MLSDHEQRTLDELGARIAAEDPHFARDLRIRQEHLPHRGGRQLVDRIVLIAAGVLGIGALAAGSVSAAAALGTATLLAWAMWRTEGLVGDGTGDRRG